MSNVNLTQTARSEPFDNTTNGFRSDLTQEAIEEIDFRQETKEPTGFVNTKYDSTINFDNATRTVTISPISGSFRYFIAGKEYIKTAPEIVQISDTPGQWFIYYSGANLTASQSVWSFESPVAFVMAIYWSVAQQKAVIINEERHGLVMDWATHRYLHNTVGMELERYKFELSDYILRGDGSLDAHATIGYSDLGRAFDEDLDFLPINSATPTLPYEQKINPVLWMPLLYRNGAQGYWESLTATQFPLAWTAGQLIKYNQWTGSTWQLSTMTDGYFVCVYICVTDNPQSPFFAILGQQQHMAIVDAASEVWNALVDDLPSKEVRPMIKLIYKTSTTYTNQPKASLFAALAIGELSVDNDRYTVEVGANGATGSGKYLERSTGSSSNDNPFIFPEAGFIRWIAVQAQAGTSATCVIGIYKLPDLTTPVLSISLSAQNYKVEGFSQYFSANDQIAWKVVSGSINKPFVTTWVQTQLG